MKFHFQLPTFTTLFLAASSITTNTLAALRGTRQLDTTADSNPLILDINCTTHDGTTCDSIPQFSAVCKERPSEMTFLYNGGRCAESFNIQTNETFTCEDFQGGPSSQDGTPSYIKAFAPTGDEVYFSGFVNVGDRFIMSPGSNAFIGMDTNITIYNPGNMIDPSDIVQPENMIQTVRFQSSCSDDDSDLFLFDKYGSAQLVEFVNDEQGSVTPFQNIILSFNIDAAADSVKEDGNITLSSLTVVSNAGSGPMMLNDRVAGQVVKPGEPIYVMEELTIDLSTHQNYIVLGMVSGTTSEGISCSDGASIQFEAGNVSL